MSIDKEQIFQFIDAHQNEMIELWRDMVNQDTYSAYKEGVDQLQNKLKFHLEADGAKVRLVEFEKAGHMLIAAGERGRSRIFAMFFRTSTLGQSVPNTNL